MFASFLYIVLDSTPASEGLGYSTVSLAYRNPQNQITEQRYNANSTIFDPATATLDASHRQNQKEADPYASENATKKNEQRNAKTDNTKF